MREVGDAVSLEIARDESRFGMPDYRAQHDTMRAGYDDQNICAFSK
jgi:hypothetical protein